MSTPVPLPRRFRRSPMTELSKVITNWLDAGTSRTRPESVPCLFDRLATTPCVERSDEDPHGFLQE